MTTVEKAEPAQGDRTSDRLTVDERGRRQRVDRYLALLARWGSRARVQKLIEDGGVRVDGLVAKPGSILRLGQHIEVDRRPTETPFDVEPEAIPLDVLYEDDWLMVINKPPGLVVHPAPGHSRGTLVAALLHHWRGARPGLDPLRPGIVHRLDKDTSGVLVIAKDPDTLTSLGKQFRDRSVDKQYIAVVWGHPTNRRGSIDKAIGRHPTNRKQMAVRGDGRTALTTYEVLRHNDRICIVRLHPRTGRTHQLRVHLTSIGHPIVGDKVYGRGHADARALIARQALHAAHLSFDHPHTGERMHFDAPLPADMQILWSACGGS